MSLGDEDIAAIDAICAAMGSPSRSAAVRRALREHARDIEKREDRMARLPRAADGPAH